MEQGWDFNAEKMEGQPKDAAFLFYDKENAFSLSASPALSSSPR